MKLHKLKWLPIGLAVGIGILMINNKLMEKKVDLQIKEPEHPVYTTRITEQLIAPQVKGYGNVTAKYSWQAIAEVSGKVIYKNPKLQRGTFIDAGEELLRIDPAPYQLALDKMEASLDNTLSEEEKLTVEQDRLRLSLAVETKALALEKKEYERQQKLHKQGTLSASSLEKQQRNYYNKQLIINDLEAQINQLPARFKALAAQKSQAQSQVEQARLDLAHTVITMPFTGRIIDVSAKLQQFVSTGSSLILAHDVSKLEVEAKMTPMQLGRLAYSIRLQSDRFDELTSVPDIDIAQLKAKITLRSASAERHWQGRVTRILGEIDARTGNVGLVVETDFDFLDFIKRNNPGESPLISGMFVEVSVDGYPQQHLTVPMEALHNDRLYLVNEDNRLEVQPVQVLFIRDQTAAIQAERLQNGQQIVLSDVVPVANGLKLAPTPWPEDKQ